jgi:hypothetical protein
MSIGGIVGFLPYVFVFVWIVSPKTIRMLYGKMNPTRSYSGWSSSDWFIRLVGIGVLIFCLILEIRARHR